MTASTATPDLRQSSHDAGGDMSIDSASTVPSGRLCPACGAPVEPSNKFCVACGTAQEVTAAAPGSAERVRRVLRCQNCSSEIATDVDQRSFVCPFCDSTYVVEFTPKESDRQRPEFVIGFAISAEQAQEKFRHWIRDNGWFRPGDLHLNMITEKMRGVYLPFWSFSMLTQTRWTTTIGEHWYRTETYTERDEKGNLVTKTRQVQETEWWPLSGGFQRYYSGYLVSASRGLAQADAHRILPFQMPALQRYEPYFLSGWLSEEYSVSRGEALQRCQQVVQSWVRNDVASFLPGDTYREPLQIDTEFSAVNSDLCLLPVFLLTYRYQNKTYTFRLNGQTGKLAGEKPVSWSKVAVCVGGLVLLIVLTGIMIAVFAR